MPCVQVRMLNINDCVCVLSIFLPTESIKIGDIMSSSDSGI